jgi:hypothetical protein
MKINLNYIYIFSSYRGVDTCLCCIVIVYSGIHKNYITALCLQNAEFFEFFNVKPSCIYSNH